jgi:hypothetical protein
MIIVFTGKIKSETNYKSKCEVNEKQFNDFIDAVGANNEGKITRTISGKEVNCWIKKIVVDIL